MKTKQQQFEEQRYLHGCGYWKNCWEHACPCQISIKDCDTYDEKIEKALIDEGNKVVDLMLEEDPLAFSWEPKVDDDDDFDYDDPFLDFNPFDDETDY